MSFLSDTPRQRASTAGALAFAWGAEAFGADDVIAAAGLTRSTALAALDDLIAIGLVNELESTTGAAAGGRLGRPARRFELCAEAGVIIGVDAGDRHVTAVVTGLAGGLLGRTALDARPFYAAPERPRTGADPSERHALVLRAIDDALAQADRDRAEVIAVVVGVPAPVDGEGRSPSHRDGFWEHMNAGLIGALAPLFPVVRVENDATLAAVAERTLGGGRGQDDFVAMLSGRRLGSGVFLEGRLVRGAHGGVGELEGLSYVPEVGGTWGLGDLVEGWVRHARDDGRVPAAHPWASLQDDDLTAESVLSVADPADPVTAALIEDIGTTLGRICSVIARFYDPSVIVVCGAIASALGEIAATARRYVAGETELPPPEIVTSTLGSDVVSLGAASAAREAALEIALPLFASRLPAQRP